MCESEPERKSERANCSGTLENFSMHYNKFQYWGSFVAKRKDVVTFVAKMSFMHCELVQMKKIAWQADPAQCRIIIVCIWEILATYIALQYKIYLWQCALCRIILSDERLIDQPPLSPQWGSHQGTSLGVQPRNLGLYLTWGHMVCSLNLWSNYAGNFVVPCYPG